MSAPLHRKAALRRRAVSAAAPVCSALALFAGVSSDDLLAADRTWFGGTGDFAVDSNWTPAGVPGASDRGILSAGTATVAADTLVGALDNMATLNINAGTFRPNGGTSSGTYNIASGAVLEMRNGSHTLTSPIIAGAGTFLVSTDNVGADASVTLNGGTLSARFHLSGSTVFGTDQIFQAPGTWSAGAFSGAASTAFQNGLAITGPGLKTLHGGRVLHLHGTTNWSGNTAANNNAIRFWNGATLNNHGTFVDANPFASFIEHNVGGPHAFNNIGTYEKQSNTVTTVDFGVAFNNSGTLNIRAGTFLPAGGSSNGTFNIASGAVLEFRNGANTLDGATVNGPGTLAISTDNVGGDAIVTVNGGTLAAPLVLSGSRLTGSDHTFLAPATWSGGAISGPAQTRFESDLNITGNLTKVLHGGRTLDLHGTTTWSGNTANNANAIQFWNGGTLVNRGRFVDANENASFIEHNVGGPHVFRNIGTYDKQSNTVTTFDFGISLVNTGTINVAAGTVHVASAFANEGVIRVSANAVFHGNNAAFVNAESGTLMGTGTFSTHANGDLANRGSIEPGFGIGTLRIDGDLLQESPGSISFELAALGNHDVLNVLDDVTLAGSIVAVNAGYQPVIGDSFVVLLFDERLAGSTFDVVATRGFGAAVRFEAIYNLHDVTLRVAAVPEPESYALMLAGLGLVVLVLRRRAVVR